MKFGFCILVVFICSYAAWAKANTDQPTSARGLGALLPKFSKIAPLAAQQIDIKESIESNLDLMARNQQTPIGIPLSSKVKQYVDTIKRYSQLNITEDFAVTVGSVKSGPLGVADRRLIEVNSVFDSRLSSEDTTRGYGLKFKFDL